MESQPWRPTQLVATRHDLCVFNGILVVAQRLGVAFWEVLSTVDYADHWPADPKEDNDRGAWHIKAWQEKVLHEVCHQVVACRGFKRKKIAENYLGDMDELETLALEFMTARRLDLGLSPETLMEEAMNTFKYVSSPEDQDFIVRAFEHNDWTVHMSHELGERILKESNSSRKRELHLIEQYLKRKLPEHYPL